MIKFSGCRKHRFQKISKSSALAVFAVIFGIGCQPQTPGDPSGVFGQGEKIGSNRLSAGDVINIALPGAPELNQSQKIRLDGKVSLPIVGEVTAAGKTPKALQEELARRYKEDLQDPQAIVSLASAAAIVYVTGAVGSPTKVLLDRELTVFEAIMEAGGFSPVADPRKVVLIRQKDGKRHRHVLDLRPGSEASGEVFYVKPYDTIDVGERIF